MLEAYSKLPLTKVARIERGKFSARPRNDPQYYGGEIPFLQTGDIARAGRVIQSWTQTLNELGLGVSKLFPRDTIFMSIAANIGDVAISGFDAACPDSVVAVKPRDGVDREWLFQSLKFSKNGLAALATQNAQANLSLEKIEPFRVHVPPLPEQRKIAEILQTWDEALEKLTALRAAKARRISALRQRLFEAEYASHNRLQRAKDLFETVSERARPCNHRCKSGPVERRRGAVRAGIKSGHWLGSLLFRIGRAGPGDVCRGYIRGSSAVCVCRGS